MHYQELHQRYGERIAKRVEAHLTASEFETTALDDLVDYLETRADAARSKYQSQLIDPSMRNELASKKTIDLLHSRWRNEEEISYLVALADDINNNPKIRIAVG